jgi:phage baseplate assembly protein W
MIVQQVVPASQLPAFLGVGLAFPMQLDATGAQVLTASNDTRVRMSITQICATGVTERPFTTKGGVPFGTRIKNIQFDSAATAIVIIQYECKRALNVWEPRIIVDNVSATEQLVADGGAAIMADIQYRYRSTNRPDNVVIPFYLGLPSSFEGT